MTGRVYKAFSGYQSRVMRVRLISKQEGWSAMKKF